MMKKVCILTDHHISINPRAWKEAFYYESRGWEVLILCKWQSKDLLEKDRKILEGHSVIYKPYLNLIKEETNTVKRFYYRARRRLAGDIQKYFKTGSGWAISHGPNLMYNAAMKENADLYSAHLECAFFAGRKLVNAGKNVSFDFEDWYSHDYLVPARPVKLLASLESFALENGLFCTSASHSMAEALQEHYDACMPEVIFNGFSVSEGKSHHTGAAAKGQFLKVLWFSRTVAQDRGLEQMLRALKEYQNPVELHLLGNTSDMYKKFLEKEFPFAKHTLKLHSFIPHHQLQDFISQFDVGLSIEEHVNENRYLTITNKILQYLQAGIPVLASDTKGNKEVAAMFPSVVIANIYQPEDVIHALDFLRNHTFDKAAGQRRFEEIFSWEAQERKLDSILNKLGYSSSCP